eukprot:CAMPEP_0170548406 /NCGR_PEP_ID=MMETSP0211-20121228/6734_1 /TAXON_ID=311385 /ORGANISM="Pseudokeronopsis sp., Strain OXSARD2" /LENGTH=148 /DNA_ID=CAMNT_0010853949 /DNA_START=431 /DNA_END=877 /DNA_ORIENTATION=-
MPLVLMDRLASVDVPNGHGAVSGSRNHQGVVPLELHDGVLVAIEQPLQALGGVQIPNQQGRVIGCSDGHVVLIHLHLGDRAIVAGQVLAPDHLRFPETQELVHPPTQDPPIFEKCATGDPLAVAVLLSIELSHLLSATQIVDSQPMVS